MQTTGNYQYTSVYYIPSMLFTTSVVCIQLCSPSLAGWHSHRGLCWLLVMFLRFINGAYVYVALTVTVPVAIFFLYRQVLPGLAFVSAAPVYGHQAKQQYSTMLFYGTVLLTNHTFHSTDKVTHVNDIIQCDKQIMLKIVRY